MELEVAHVAKRVQQLLQSSEGFPPKGVQFLRYSPKLFKAAGGIVA